MSQQSEIIDLTGSSNAEIIEAVSKLIDENQFSKFTIVLKRLPKKNNDALLSNGQSKRLKTKHSVNLLHKHTNSDYSFRLNGPYSERHQSEEDPDDNYHTALRLYKQQEYDDALQLFQQEQTELKKQLKQKAQSSKNYHDVCFHIGNCYYRMKQYQKAIQYFSKKFQGEEIKQQGQKFNNLGSCYAHLDQERLSLNYYTQAFKIYSLFSEINCSNLLNNLGTLYAQSGVFDTAEKYFLQSIQERKLKSPETQFHMYCSYMQLGSCQKNANKLSDAIETLKDALRIAERGYGEQSQTLMQLASIYQKAQKWNNALNSYERLSVISSKKGFLYEKAAVLHRNMGHFSDYDRLIKQAFQQYTKQRNDRKLSELRPVMSRLNKK